MVRIPREAEEYRSCGPQFPDQQGAWNEGDVRGHEHDFPVANATYEALGMDTACGPEGLCAIRTPVLVPLFLAPGHLGTKQMLGTYAVSELIWFGQQSSLTLVRFSHEHTVSGTPRTALVGSRCLWELRSGKPARGRSGARPHVWLGWQCLPIPLSEITRIYVDRPGRLSACYAEGLKGMYDAERQGPCLEEQPGSVNEVG